MSTRTRFVFVNEINFEAQEKWIETAHGIRIKLTQIPNLVINAFCADLLQK